LFNGQAVRPIAVLNRQESRVLALKLFEGLGQTGPLWLSNVLPRTLEDNRGMPCLVANINRLQAEKAQLAGLWCAEQGLDFSQFGEGEVSALSAALPWLLLRVAEKLMNGTLLSFRERRSVRIENAFAIEGEGVIRSEFWKNWPKAGSRWDAIDAVLDRSEKRLRQDALLEGNSVRLRHALWDDLPYDTEDIHITVGLNCEGVKLDDGDLLVDRDSCLRMLNTYYGFVPELGAA
jgi:hypothetical protein